MLAGDTHVSSTCSFGCLWAVLNAACTRACLPAYRYYFGYKIATYKMQNVEVSDARVLRMHEVLLAIKLVKFYVWERSFARQVEDVSQGQGSWGSCAGWVPTGGRCASKPVACSSDVLKRLGCWASSSSRSQHWPVRWTAHHVVHAWPGSQLWCPTRVQCFHATAVAVVLVTVCATVNLLCFSYVLHRSVRRNWS